MSDLSASTGPSAPFGSSRTFESSSAASPAPDGSSAASTSGSMTSGPAAFDSVAFDSPAFAAFLLAVFVAFFGLDFDFVAIKRIGQSFAFRFVSLRT